MTDQERALQQLNTYRNRLQEFDYDDIKMLIKESIKQIPIAEAKLYTGAPIDRVRPNYDVRFFTSQDQVSYISNPETIRGMTKFGRANMPHQSLFYGAIESTEIKHNRLTAYYETSNLLEDTSTSLPEGELFTISRWHTTKELTLAELVFSDEAIKVNPDTAKSFQKHFNSLREHPMREIGLQQMRIFSEEFARKATSHHDYKIAVAYADLLMNEGNFPGILYPSVKSGYKGQCVVLRPDIVDDYMYLESVSTHRMHKHLKNCMMANYYHTIDFGERNQKFTWNEHELDEPARVSQFSEFILSKPQPQD